MSYTLLILVLCADLNRALIAAAFGPLNDTKSTCSLYKILGWQSPSVIGSPLLALRFSVAQCRQERAGPETQALLGQRQSMGPPKQSW